MNILQIGCNNCEDDVFLFFQENEKDVNEIVLVDAIPECVDIARKKYDFTSKAKFENLAITPLDIGPNKTLTLYKEQDNPISDLTSVNRDFIIEQRSEFGPPPELVSFETQIASLNSVFERYPETTHLFIDIEGLDVVTLFSLENKYYEKLNLLVFEFIHTDGFKSCGGPKLQAFLNYLNSFGFKHFTTHNFNLIASK